MCTLAYADDVMLISEDVSGMRLMMREFQEYVRQNEYEDTEKKG